MNRRFHFFQPSHLKTPLALALAALVAACSSPVKLDEVPVESRTGTPVGTDPSAAGAAGAGTGATPQSQVANVDLSRQAAMAAAPVARTVYFDFDSFVIKDEFKPVVEGNARNLVNNRSRKLVVEGHTDERGGREYNLALGQKRAEAVVRSLTLLGATEAQLEAVSFGEERPAVQGSDESAWSKNRRAELRDR